MQAPSAITALPAASKEERGEQEQRSRLSSLAREFADISLLAPTFAGAIIA